MSNEQKIWNYLKSNGLNNYGAAGLMGNLFAESGLISNNLQDIYNQKLGLSDEEYTNKVNDGTYTNFIKDSAGYGLAQWTWHSRKKNLLNYAKSKGKSIGDLDMQLEFLIQELISSYATVLATLKTASSVQEASNIVLTKFECPADQSAATQAKRASYGMKYYNKYADENNSTINYNEGGTLNMGTKTYTKGISTKLSTNFTSKEFDCKGVGCCSSTPINSQLVEYLQQIRDHFNKPITITSGYRCTTHNKNIGGATGSRHTKGDAADIVVSGITPAEVAQYAESIGIKGIGLYETNTDGHFVHIDTRSTKSFWYGQAQAYRSTFGGSTTSSTATSTNNTYLLIYGNKGDAVKELQEKLLALGYDLGSYGADGQYGAATQKAVKKFQADNELDDDGIAGSLTLEKLEEKYSALSSSSNSTSYKVTATLLNVRQGPGTNYPIVSRLSKGTKIVREASQSGWTKIKSPAGWVSEEYIEKI